MTQFEKDVISVYEKLTKTEKKVADYVLKEPQKVLFLSINELADRCEVGDASVYRFCRNIGLKGYQEFKVRLSLSQTIKTPVPESEQSDFSELANELLDSYMLALNHTKRTIEEKQVQILVEKIKNANCVYFFGLGNSGIVARDALNKFIRITPKVRYISDSHMQIMVASTITKDDVVILISDSGETLENLQVLENSQKRGAKVCSITSYKESTLAKKSDITLITSPLSRDSLESIISVKIAQTYTIDLIYQTYYKSTLEQSTENRNLTNDAIVKKIF